MSNTTIKVALTNLGKYNEGELIFTWLELPASDEEISEAFKQIGVAPNTEYEEHFISDYEAPFSISEYASLSALNEKAELLDDLSKEEVDAVCEIADHIGMELEEAVQAHNDGDIMYYHECRDMGDVAREWYEQTGMLDEITKHISEHYIDFDAIGRDMDIEGTFVELSGNIYAQYLG